VSLCYRISWCLLLTVFTGFSCCEKFCINLLSRQQSDLWCVARHRLVLSLSSLWSYSGVGTRDLIEYRPDKCQGSVGLVFGLSVRHWSALARIEPQSVGHGRNCL